MAQSKSNTPFFSGKYLSDLTREYETQIKGEVESWERNRILGASEPDLVAYLREKYTLNAPWLLRDQFYIYSEGEDRIDVSGRFEYGYPEQDGTHIVPGQYVTVAIPFEGDSDLFWFRASTYSIAPPHGQVKGNEVLITFRDVRLHPQQTRQKIDSVIDSIEESLRWISSDCIAWNGHVQKFAERCVQNRKRRLLQQADLVQGLGLPIKRSSDAASVISVPVYRKKRPVSLPPTPTEAFKPEPTLQDDEYDFILSVIDRLATSIERNPSTFAHMQEEQIRDLLLVDLNGHYEGGATGETFNARGKTDILIRAEGRNVFIAECKIWGGPKTLIAAIDQILDYLTWRDTKASLLIFSRNKDFTNVLSSIAETVPKHPNFKRELKRVSDTHVRYLFQQKDDPARDLYLTVQAFHLPT